MSSIKITDLPKSTLPYSGNEDLLIVQNGYTTTNSLCSLTNYLSGSLLADTELTFTGGISANNKTIVREALVGEVTAPVGINTTTIANDVVTNAKLANMAEFTFKGRLSAGTGDPEDLSVSQVQSLVVTSSAVGSAIANVNVVQATEIREELLLNDTAIPDALNWQPYCVSKVAATSAGSSILPLRVLIAGDSLSTGLRMPPNAANLGMIGCSLQAGTVNLTSYAGGNTPNYADVWLAPYHTLGVGGSATFHVGSQGSATAIPQRANELSVMYIAESGAASFDISYLNTNGTAWTVVSSISANNNGSMEGRVFTTGLSVSTGPRYIARINNVTGSTGAIVRIIAVGLYSTTGLGVVELKGLANIGGIDTVNYGNIPDSVFTPLWTYMSPDLVVSHYADAPEEWQETKLALSNVVTNNGTTSISFSSYPPTEYANGNAYRPYIQVGDYITGQNIPANTRITAHTRNGTTATISNSATGSGTYSAIVRGAFVSFYDRCSAIKTNTDWIQFSMNPTMSPALSNHERWISGTYYPTGTRVTTYDADGTLPPNNTRIDRVYVAKVAHTAAESTLPAVGGSWPSVWDEDLQDVASVLAGTARARQQAKAQREWAIREGQSFINGFDIFRDYTSACLRGLMAEPDTIHPTPDGHVYKNMVLWSKVPLTRVNLGAIVNLSSPGSNNLIFSTITPTDVINNTSGIVELSRKLRIAGTGGAINFGDTSAVENTSLDVTISNTGGVLSIGTAANTGNSSLLGWHPTLLNGSTLGGRSSNWWNLGGAGLRLEYHAVTTHATISSSNYTINVTSNSVTVQLPAATVLNSANLANAGAGAMGKVYCVKNSGTGTTVTLSANGAQLINSLNTIPLTSSQMVKVQSTGTGWITIM